MPGLLINSKKKKSKINIRKKRESTLQKKRAKLYTKLSRTHSQCKVIV